MNRVIARTGAAAALLGLLLVAFAPAALAQRASANDTARYLAGLKPSPGSPLNAYTDEGAWIRHAATLGDAWRRLEKNQLSDIRSWVKKHVPGHRQLMLYMFSGPDFLYADAFYPHASTYVLSALEPIGPLPDVSRLHGGGRAAALQDLRASTQSVLTFSFFITKEMKSDLHTAELSGALPVLYVFLARAGKTIEEVTFVSLNDDGTVTPRDGKTPKGSAEGVKIVFTGEGGKPRTLYYFRTDLSNGGLKNSGLRKFCQSIGPADSLVKSASYLMHGGGFSAAREFLLEHSAVLIQDSSGIPLRYFSRKEWELYPFGRYVGPISIFAQNYEPGMRALFRGAPPATFGIGYRWRTHETHVLLAVKRSLEGKTQ